MNSGTHTTTNTSGPATPPTRVGGGKAWNQAQAAAIIAEHQGARGALLPILHALNEAFGHIDDSAVPMIARALNLSRADVHGVISFYHDFRRNRPGRHIVKVCRAEACQAAGANQLIEHITRNLSVDFTETTADGLFTLEAVFCLGNCALGPAVMVGEKLCGRVTPARLNAVLEEVRRADEADRAAADRDERASA